MVTPSERGSPVAPTCENYTLPSREGKFRSVAPSHWPGLLTDLAEIPADDRVGGDAQPGMPAVVVHLPTGVLVGEELFGHVEFGHQFAGARDFADRHGAPFELDSAEFHEALA